MLSHEVKSLPLNQADQKAWDMHCFLLPKCALGKLIVHGMIWLFRDIILYGGIGDTASCCRAWVIARCSSASVKILLSVHAQFQNRTRWTMCYGHDSYQLSKQIWALVAGKCLEILRWSKFLEPTHFWECLTNACTSLGWMAMASDFLQKCASITSEFFMTLI